MIQVRANNKIYKNFKKVEVSIDMDNLCGSFSFVSSVSKDGLFPLKVNDYIEIDADGTQIINGFIDTLNKSHSTNTRDIRVGGSSVIADILHSVTTDMKSIVKRTTLKGSYLDFDAIEAGEEDVYETTTTREFQGPITLKNIARILLDNNGMKKTKVINRAGTIKSFTKDDIESSNLGETIFDFLEGLARMRQVLINSDEYGNLVLSRGAGDYSTKITNNLINKKNNIENNIKSASLRLNNEDRYWAYVVHSNINPIQVKDRVGSIVNEVGGILDNEVRITRSLEMEAEDDTDRYNCEHRAKWEKNIRKVRAFTYSAIIQGHSVNKIPYKINTLVNVIDEFCDINNTLLIKGVTFNYSIDGGSTTTLDCVLKDAYTIEMAEEFIKSNNVSSVEQAKRDADNARNKGGYDDFDEIDRWKYDEFHRSDKLH